MHFQLKWSTKVCPAPFVDANVTTLADEHPHGVCSSRRSTSHAFECCYHRNIEYMSWCPLGSIRTHGCQVTT